MKNKLTYSAILVAGMAFATTYGNHVFGQTRQNSSMNQETVEATTYSLPDSINVKVIQDTTGMENGQMQMKKDSLHKKNYDMMHDTTAVKEYQMNKEVYKKTDVKSDTTKIR